MQKIECFVAENGILETDPMRAKAHDIAHYLGRAANQKAIGTSSNGTSKIDWHAAMEILENGDEIIKQIQQYKECVAIEADLNDL